MKIVLLVVCLLSLYPGFVVASDEIGETGFYISKDMTAYKATDIPILLEKITNESPDKNLLFYVHGRSQTLEKEMNNIISIEDTYNVRVIMLHWDSWNFILGRPVGNAIEATKLLELGLNQFYQFKSKSRNYFSAHKVFLMFHSMGNILLKEYLKKYTQIQDSTFFDSVILSGADVPFTGHKKWLEKLSFSRDIFVVTNRNDAVLSASVAHDYVSIDLTRKNDDRLGLGNGLDNFLFFNARLSINASYFDITKLSGSEHRHFLSSNRLVENLFHYMFKENFDEIPLQYKMKNNYYKFF